MPFLYLDIETIPAQDEATRERIAATVKPPAAMKKAETIAAWEAEQKQAAIDEAVARSGLDGAYGQICCIGYAFDDEPPHSVFLMGSEGNMLRYFAQFISTSNYAPVIVGHNVAAFDIRFIWQRAMVNGVRLPAWFPRDPKPWGNEVFDTMTAWAGARDRISLDNLCTALGLPGKDGIDGSMVGKMWAEGRHDEIAEYCRQDVERVRQVHRKMQIALGEAA